MPYHVSNLVQRRASSVGVHGRLSIQITKMEEINTCERFDLKAYFFNCFFTLNFPKCKGLEKRTQYSFSVSFKYLYSMSVYLQRNNKRLSKSHSS